MTYQITGKPFNCLFNSLLRQTKRNYQCFTSLALCEGIHLWLADSLHKGPIILQVFSCQDIIIFINLDSYERPTIKNKQDKISQASWHIWYLYHPWSVLYSLDTFFLQISKAFLIGVTHFQSIFLTHWGRVTHICVSKLTTIVWSAPSHYLNQWWDIVNSNLGNKFQWFLKRNSSIFIQENAFENVVRKMAAMLFRPQCEWTRETFVV